MDPNAVLSKIDDFLLNREIGNCVDVWCEHLYFWLLKGGFEPEWDMFSRGTSYFKCRKYEMNKVNYKHVEQ